MSDSRPLVVVGAGWLGRAVATAQPGCVHMAQREFAPTRVPTGASIIVASGWSSLSPDDPESKVRGELDDVSAALDTARRLDARIVVVGSSDVCGLAEVVAGSTAVDPVTRYGELKAAREALVEQARADGVDAVAVRLAPTHGPGKPQTLRMVALASKRVVPLPRGGRYSVGFVTLADAVAAFVDLGRVASPPVVAVGGGPTPLRSVIEAIGASQGYRTRILRVPMPASAAARLATMSNSRLAWVGRFSLPRSVAMETSVEPMSLSVAGRYLLDR